KRTQDQIAANDAPLDVSEIAGATKSALPKSVTPMLATLADDLPVGDRWIYELKWDGVRAICFISEGKIRIEYRNDKRIEAKYQELKTLPSLLDVTTAVLDGEIVVLDDQGRARFELIQPRISTSPARLDSLLKTNPVKFIAYDLLYLDGYDLRGVPLETRK